ncbi:ubiquitin hydrolase, partial [Trypanosoma conorhini]
NEVLCAAVVPAAAAPGQRSGEAAEEEAPENDGSDVKEEEEGEVYIWYFIRARGAPRSALGELCDVERVPAKVCSTFSDFVKHIMARREYLEGRYLKEKATAGVEVAGAALDPPRVQTVDGGDGGDGGGGGATRLLYQLRRGGESRCFTGAAAETELRDAGVLNPAGCFLGEFRLLLEFDSSVHALSERLSSTTVLSAVGGGNDSSCDASADLAEMGNAVTLKECLEATYAPDRLEGENAIECDKCKARRASNMKRRLFLLPPCLLISLKRFRVHMEETSKNNTCVMFPKELDMAPFLDPESPVQNATYSLRGVVTHRGSINYGHYSACVMSDSCGEWVRYDDQCTSKVQGPPDRDAFILCYERAEFEADKAGHAVGRASGL